MVGRLAAAAAPSMPVENWRRFSIMSFPPHAPDLLPAASPHRPRCVARLVGGSRLGGTTHLRNIRGSGHLTSRDIPCQGLRALQRRSATAALAMDREEEERHNDDGTELRSAWALAAAPAQGGDGDLVRDQRRTSEAGRPAP